MKFRFLYSRIYWVLDFYRILWVLLVVDIAVHSAKNLSNKEGNKGFVWLSLSLSLWSQADPPLFVAFVHIHGVSNSDPHQGIIPPSFSLWLNLNKHLCSPHRGRFQWSWWLWQCSLHRHLNWICKQSQLTVANRSEQVFTNISYIILSTYFDHFELRSNATSLSLYLSLSLSLSEAKLTYRYLLHLSIFMASRTPTLIKESYLQAFHYDSISTSTCAALIGGGSSEAGGSDSVACIGTSTESASRVNWQWQTDLNRSSPTPHISFSQHILITWSNATPLPLSLSLSPFLSLSLSLSLKPSWPTVICCICPYSWRLQLRPSSRNHTSKLFTMTQLRQAPVFAGASGGFARWKRQAPVQPSSVEVLVKLVALTV